MIAHDGSHRHGLVQEVHVLPGGSPLLELARVDGLFDVEDGEEAAQRDLQGRAILERLAGRVVLDHFHVDDSPKGVGFHLGLRGKAIGSLPPMLEILKEGRDAVPCLDELGEDEGAQELLACQGWG